MKITDQEAFIHEGLGSKVYLPPLLRLIIEQIAFTARNSELIDQKSGVSARLTISALELLYSAVEQRMLHNGESRGSARLSDLISVVPAMTGKMELVYEGEQLGPYETALSIINQSIKKIAAAHLPKIESKKKSVPGPFQKTTDWFGAGHSVELDVRSDEKSYQERLLKCPVQDDLLKQFDKKDQLFGRELVLHYLASANAIQKEWVDRRILFKDPLSSMLNDLNLQ